MLDERTSALLRAIAGNCPPGKYRVFSGEDFASLFAPPEGEASGPERAEDGKGVEGGEGPSGGGEKGESRAETDGREQEARDAALTKMFARLSEEGCINVKYAGGGMYCVCPLPAARRYLESPAPEEEKKPAEEAPVLAEETRAEKDGPSFRGGVLGGLLGGLIGGLIASSVSAILFLLFR